GVSSSQAWQNSHSQSGWWTATQSNTPLPCDCGEKRRPLRRGDQKRATIPQPQKLRVVHPQGGDHQRLERDSRRRRRINVRGLREEASISHHQMIRGDQRLKRTRVKASRAERILRHTEESFRPHPSHGPSLDRKTTKGEALERVR